MNRRSYERWAVTPYQREARRFDPDADALIPWGPEDVVFISDPRGWSWEVVLTPDRRAIESLTIHGTVTAEVLKATPVGYLVEVAASALARRDAAMSPPGAHLDDAMREAASAPGMVALEGDPPTLEAFAQVFEACPPFLVTADGTRITRRVQLAQQFGVSKYAVDKWTRKARDAGLIAPPDPSAGGRKRQTRKTTKTSPDGKAPSSKTSKGATS